MANEKNAPVGGITYKNDGGARRKVSKNTLKGARISLDGRGSNGYFPLRGTKSKSFC